jgi:hypothetical protein
MRFATHIAEQLKRIARSDWSRADLEARIDDFPT